MVPAPTRNAGVLLWDEVEKLEAEMDQLLALAAAGVVRPIVDRVFPLADAPEAQRYLHDRKRKGEVLLACRWVTGSRCRRRTCGSGCRRS